MFRAIVRPIAPMKVNLNGLVEMLSIFYRRGGSLARYGEDDGVSIVQQLNISQLLLKIREVDRWAGGGFGDRTQLDIYGRLALIRLTVPSPMILV